MGRQDIDSAVRQLVDRVEQYRLAVSAFLGCSASESRVLDLIRERGPLGVGQVSRAVGVRHSVVTGIADRLVARGLLERRPDATDRRRSILALPEERVAALDTPYQLFGEAMVDLDDERAQEVIDALRVVGEMLDRGSDALVRKGRRRTLG
ncbi:MarR family transcriptional regulator [Lapillicoccus jejuensis]|uniref:DNA-binding MarR family transcriptional regulator n=2 Tax=Lapillicoccus jejuensis TaxID=402171 RepID=A0A542E0B3_9MICO|nr:MarR family transcriptional regulator [Lapillicoccus jejuensis]TQJ08792.1 DNA-binding MarR family transcriptional regulator [Lapillicoccus jejuensis]